MDRHASYYAVADTVFSFSTTLLAILLLGVFKSSGVLTVIAAICIADWVRYARTMRGSVLEVKQEVYVMAARASGARDVRIPPQTHPAQRHPAHPGSRCGGPGRGDHAGGNPELPGGLYPLTEPSLGMMTSHGPVPCQAICGGWYSLPRHRAHSPGCGHQPFCRLVERRAQSQNLVMRPQSHIRKIVQSEGNL